MEGRWGEEGRWGGGGEGGWGEGYTEENHGARGRGEEFHFVTGQPPPPKIVASERSEPQPKAAGERREEPPPPTIVAPERSEPKAAAGAGRSDAAPPQKAAAPAAGTDGPPSAVGAVPPAAVVKGPEERSPEQVQPQRPRRNQGGVIVPRGVGEGGDGGGGGPGRTVGRTAGRLAGDRGMTQTVQGDGEGSWGSASWGSGDGAAGGVAGGWYGDGAASGGAGAAAGGEGGYASSDGVAAAARAQQQYSARGSGAGQRGDGAGYTSSDQVGAGDGGNGSWGYPPGMNGGWNGNSGLGGYGGAVAGTANQAGDSRRGGAAAWGSPAQQVTGASQSYEQEYYDADSNQFLHPENAASPSSATNYAQEDPQQTTAWAPASQQTALSLAQHWQQPAGARPPAPPSQEEQQHPSSGHDQTKSASSSSPAPGATAAGAASASAAGAPAGDQHEAVLGPTAGSPGTSGSSPGNDPKSSEKQMQNEPPHNRMGAATNHGSSPTKRPASWAEASRRPLGGTAAAPSGFLEVVDPMGDSYRYAEGGVYDDGTTAPQLMHREQPSPHQ